MDSRTSDGSLLSSPHGAMRREHRNISKLDLQSVKKYGTKVRTYGHNRRPRWKFTFADTVYVTEDDGVTEVTSYILPLSLTKALVTSQDGRMHEALVRKLQTCPSIATSHTVVVVDQSASMLTCDVDNYKTRSDAVYASIAVDYIAQQIDNRNQSNVQYTDVVTLIEMNETSQIIFEREPCTNVLYNKILHRREIATPRSHGMYEHALSLASQVLLKDAESSSCPLQLLFLSDGKPSDAHANPAPQIFNLCNIFKHRLTVVTLGFAKNGSDFSVLEHMAESACAAGSHGLFTAVDLRGNDLSATIESLSHSMSHSRQMCSLMSHSHVKGGLAHTPRTPRTNIISEPKPSANYNFETDIDKITNDHWDIYRIGCRKLHWQDHQLVAVDSVEGVAICKAKLGEGAERIVFRLKELVMRDGKLKVSGKRLVAKECKYMEDLSQREFHETFCKTQAQAAKLATKFNQKVTRCCHVANIEVDAIIKFLRCSVYEVPLPSESDSYRYILVENRLDTSKYMKWNSNAGFVRGFRSVEDVLNQQEVGIVVLKKPPALLDAIVEEQDIEDSDDEERSVYEEEEEQQDPAPKTAATGSRSAAIASYSIKLEDYPQAFSHYTYRYSQRSKLVCDLQGVLDTSVTPAVFELTDPVIHYKASSRKKQAFGRTDHGSHGINKFFETHVCNDLCRMLGLNGY